jgi:hypothetical protein
MFEHVNNFLLRNVNCHNVVFGKKPGDFVQDILLIVNTLSLLFLLASASICETFILEQGHA